MNRSTKLTLAALATSVLSLAPTLSASAVDTVPSGQRTLGHSVVEPIYDGDHAGVVGFISTPEHTPLVNDQHARAPIYLPVYPAGATVGQLICPHVPVDTCPDHGPTIAALAQSIAPDVYVGGVVGHDHIAKLEGAGTRVSLVPTLVLFTSKPAANEHLITLAQIEAAVVRGDAVLVSLPPAALHAEQVSTRIWQLATPMH